MLKQKNFNFQFITDILERQLLSVEDPLVLFIKSLLIDCDFENFKTLIQKIQKEVPF